MKEMYFIAGLPRSGSTMLANIFKQNPSIHGEAVSSMSVIFNSILMNWDNIEANKEYSNETAKLDVLYSVIEGYYKSCSKPIVIDKDRQWIAKIPQLEAVLNKKVKIIVCVRNPAEILTSFERIRKENPLVTTLTDASLGDGSTIASRAMYFAGPGGPLGISHALLKDALTMGYLDRLKFVDYNRFCNTPKSQMKRIYDFLEIENFEHNFYFIKQDEIYDDKSTKLPNLHKIRPSLEKTTYNPVQYLGLELYQQYNSEIFWDTLI